MRTVLFALFLANVYVVSVKAQVDTTEASVSVRGRVTNRLGKPLGGAIVLIASTSKGTPTDQQGYYVLSNVPYGETLVFSNIGYQMVFQPVPNEQKLLNQQVLNAVLDVLREELPPMGATAVFKAVKPNKARTTVAIPLESVSQTGVAVEENAHFPTGIAGLMEYVAHHLRYPASAKKARLTGDVLVFFTVTPAGTVDEVTIGKGIDNDCDREAMRVVQQMPAWIPARQNGQPIASAYSVPIRFALE